MTTILRPVVSFASQHVCSSSRRSLLLELQRPPYIRPLHASPIFQRPRRRDFFSSNTLLAVQKAADSEQSKSPPAQDPDQTRKRKNARSPAAKISLRRVAVEAQRSKDGRIQKTRSTGEGATAPRLVTAYAVAEQFDLAKVVDILRANGYRPDPFGTGLYPQVVHTQIPTSPLHRGTNHSPEDLNSDEVGDVFVFPSGTVVTWSLPEGWTSYFATRTLSPAADAPHGDSFETEDLDYIEDSSREHSHIRGDTIILGTKPASSISDDQPEQSFSTILTKVAFSSGFARSTKLAVLETTLSHYLHSTSEIPRLLSRGSRLPVRLSRPFILRKTGQLLSLRAQLNLYSELTDSLPDLFWDSTPTLNLETYYDQVGRALDVGIRIKVLNEKMDYAQEIASVLREQLSEKHGLFLEWTIIVLIAIEVGFEVLRLWKDGFWEEVWVRRVNGGATREGNKEDGAGRILEIST